MAPARRTTPARRNASRADDPAPEAALFPLDVVTADGRKRIVPRYYQIEAVQTVTTSLRDGGRGQVRSACGTGKTVIGQCCAEVLCPCSGLVVITCPSIALVSQTLREWSATNQDHVALAVCGDSTVSDSVATVDDLPCRVTTDPADVAGWLRAPAGAALRLIVGTHRSAHVIGQGLQLAGRAADLLIVDEAHRSAGRVDKHTALVHDDDMLPARRRLYATATPKIIGEKALSRSRGSSGRTAEQSFAKQLIGMDDERVFGPVLYDYPVARAIEDGYLDDYRLVVMGATRREILEHLSGLPRGAVAGDSSIDLHTAMVQTVLAKAAKQFRLRRVVTFCRRLNEARAFARSMGRTLSALPEAMRPPGKLTAAFVHGGMTTAQRQQRLDLLTDPPEDGWTVITNVRCLAEGVDVPAIDCVAFTHPKQSVSEIVQAVGRALRRDPDGTGTATVLVPLLLPDEPGDLDETGLEDYRLLWQVVRALRAHDDKLGAAIDRAELPRARPRFAYEDQPLEHVLVTLPPGYDDGSFLQYLTTRIVTSARNPWWDGYAALQQFHARTGHALVPPDHVTDDDPPFTLGAWADNTRDLHRRGRLGEERTQALHELGFDLLSRAVEWAAGLRAATAFYAEHRHLEPVRSLRVRGVELRAWLDRQRALADAGDLAGARRAQLDALGMRWHPAPETFDDHLAALRDYHGRHGDIDIIPDPDTADGRLGRWLVEIRVARKMGKLTDGEIASLDVLGMRWTARPVPAAVFRPAPG